MTYDGVKRKDPPTPATEGQGYLLTTGWRLGVCVIGGLLEGGETEILHLIIIILFITYLHQNGGGHVMYFYKYLSQILPAINPKLK